MQRFRIVQTGLIVFITLGLFVLPAVAAAPSGDDTFQLLASPFTGGDNTGDGGTGLASDLNYYYVGQSFTATMEITSGGADAANIIIDYDDTKSSASDLTDGTFFTNWAGQSIAGGTILSTGFRLGGLSSGTGNFGTFDIEMIEPTVAAYGTGSPTAYDIDLGTVGNTTESNISLVGNDILDDVEDFAFHVWADTVKPFVENVSPTDAATGVSVFSDLTFDLNDTLNGEGDNTGVGTGVNTSEPPGVITLSDGGPAVDMTPYSTFSCSGVWGTNFCDVTVDLPSPTGIASDTRNLEYNTTYTLVISDFEDLASAAQDQLGDANGPNVMDTKMVSFTTENDIAAPFVSDESPPRGTSGNSITTNVVIDVVDQDPALVSGVGVDSTSCSFNISSASFPLTTFTEGDAQVSVVPIDYGFRFTIDPASNFAQNETVSVSAFDCEDLEGNIMTTDNWTFSTADSDAPFVDARSPADDSAIAADGTVSFHIKDEGAGVDLSSVFVFVNGAYWTDGGGPGSVATTGTFITWGSSFDFNGGNYALDTTSVTGSSADFTFVIDPEANFVFGEAVPVIIYASDNSGNLMERDVYAPVVGAGAVQACGNGVTEGNEVCDDGNLLSGDGCSASCLSDESCGNFMTDVAAGEECDDGDVTDGDGCDSVCQFEASVSPPPAGSGGGGSGGGGSAEVLFPKVSAGSVNVIQIDETSVLVTWFSNLPGTSRVLYDAVSHDVIGAPPNYGYLYSTAEQDDNRLYHSVVVNGLTTGTLYHFRPLTRARGHEAWGEEVRMAPVFGTILLECVAPEQLPLDTSEPEIFIVEVERERIITIPVPTPARLPSSVTEDDLTGLSPQFEITHVERSHGAYRFYGNVKPNATIRLIIF